MNKYQLGERDIFTKMKSAAPQLLGDIRQLIEQSRVQLNAAVNSALTMLYWHIGHRIRTEVLGSERASYGEQIVSALSRQLESDYGRGFSAKNLRHMLRFVEAFPDAGIVSTLSRQLAWSHFLEDPYVLDFLGLQDRYLEKTWKTPSCGSWKTSCWNWVPVLPSSPGKSVSRSTTTIFTSTSYSTIAA